ncbi:hypothetical protein D3C72_2499480 [compost metagenome]
MAAAENRFDELTQPFANQSKLMREVENAASAQRVALLMHAHDHLAVEALQQRLKLGT